MALVQEWSAAGADTGAITTAVQSGPATTAGSDLVVRGFIRSSITPGSVTVTDDGGNSYTQIGYDLSGSAHVYVFHCPAAADPATSVSLTWVDPSTSQPFAEEAIVLLTEFTDASVLVEVSTAVIVGGGLPPTITPSTGQTLFGAWGTNVGGQSGTLLSTNITATQLQTHNSGSSGIHLNGGYGFTTNSSPVAIGWDQTSGTDRGYVFINALFAPTGGGTDTTPPVIQITSPAEGATVNTATPTIAGTSDVFSANITLSVDGGGAITVTTASNGNFAYTPATLSDGAHTVVVTATDAANNTATDTVNFQVDTSVAPPEEDLVFVQEWTDGGSTNPVNPVVQTGPATTAGSGLFVRGFIRSTATPDQVTLTDNAGTNVWTLVASESYGSSYIYLFHAPNADPVTSVSMSYVDLATGQPYSEEGIVLLTEFSGVGALISAHTAVLVGGGLPPSHNPAGPGMLLIGAWGTNVAQSGQQLSLNITPIELAGTNSSTSGINFRGAYGLTSGNLPASLGWDQESGSDREYSFITALYAPTGYVPPPPLPETGRSMLTAAGWTPATTTLL